MTLPEIVTNWRDRGKFLGVAGREIFVVDTGLAKDSRALVLLHGFPSSSSDWRGVLDALAARRRVIAADLPGYGLSEKPADYGYSLFEQADVVQVLLRELGVTGADIMAHDMGTSVACELAARRERGLLGFSLQSLILMNGSIHVEMCRLTPSQRLLLSPLAGLFTRLASERLFTAQLRRILGRPVADDELHAMWAQINHRGGTARLPQLIEYVRERRRFAERWIGALTRLDIPVQVLWGPKDPVAVPAIARQLAAEIPGATLKWLPGLGHYPQLEDPALVAEAAADFLDAVSFELR